MRRYLGDLRNFGGRRLVFLSAITTASALTDGIGLLMLVPLLEVVGAGGGSGVGDVFVRTFDALGIDLTLRSVLMFYVLLVVVRAALGRTRAVHVARFQIEFVDWQRLRLFEAIARADWLYQVRRRSSDVMHGITTDIARVGLGTNLLQVRPGQRMGPGCRPLPRSSSPLATAWSLSASPQW